jgi:hypothetical protein
MAIYASLQDGATLQQLILIAQLEKGGSILLFGAIETLHAILIGLLFVFFRPLTCKDLQFFAFSDVVLLNGDEQAEVDGRDFYNRLKVGLILAFRNEGEDTANVELDLLFDFLSLILDQHHLSRLELNLDAKKKATAIAGGSLGLE